MVCLPNACAAVRNKGIDGRPHMVGARAAHQVQLALSDKQMTVGWRDVNAAWLEALAVAGMLGVQWTGLIEDVRQTAGGVYREMHHHADGSRDARRQTVGQLHQSFNPAG